MKRIITTKSVTVLLFAALMLISGCKGADSKNSVPDSQTQTPQAKIAALQGPTALSILKMWDDEISVGGKTPSYELLGSPDALVAELVRGTYDFAFLPLNRAVNLFNKGTDYRLAGINTWGNMYIISSDESIKTLADLEGKTVAVSEQGATPDVTLRYCLEKAGLTGKVTLDYTLTAHPDLTASVVSGAVKIALLPEPFVSNALNQNNNIKIALDMQAVWGEATGGEPFIPMTAVVVKGSFFDKYPQAVSQFTNALSASSDWAAANPELLAELAGDHGVTLPKAAIINGTVRCNIFFEDAQEATTRVKDYINILLGFSPDDIGGKTPSETFFTNLKNAE